MEKKLDGNNTRMLKAILNKSSRQNPTKQLLCGHLPPIMKTIQVRRTRHAGHCWRSKDKLISDILQWIYSYTRAKAGRQSRTYIQQICADTVCSLEGLPGAMDDRNEWREKVWEIRAGSLTWWWWWRWWIPKFLSLSLFGCYVKVFGAINFSYDETAVLVCICVRYDFQHEDLLRNK